MDLSTDGRYVVSGAQDGMIRVFRVLDLDGGTHRMLCHAGRQ